MDDLATRLLAAIEATEYLAQQADHGPWEVRDEEHDTYVIPVNAPRPIVASLELLPNGWHIARHDPASALRRCAADRKIVDEHYDNGGFRYDTDGVTLVRSGPIGTKCITCVADEREIGSEFSEMAAYPCKTLVLLAEGYGITEETDNA